VPLSTKATPGFEVDQIALLFAHDGEAFIDKDLLAPRDKLNDVSLKANDVGA
jgi:hypothetical protein